MAKYNTVLFDADNTLLDFLRSEREALCIALHEMGVLPNDELIQGYSAINSAVWKRLERGEISKQELKYIRFSDFCQAFSLSVDAKELAERYLSALATQSYLMQGALEVCRTLSQHCRLYIITNGIAAVQHGRLDNSPLRPFFRDVFISEEIGFEKPHKAFFDAVAKQIPNFDPCNTLVVGDSLSSDIAGGIGAGLDTCWLAPVGKTAPSEISVTYVVHRLKDVIQPILGL